MRADYAEIFQSTENVDKYTDVVYAPGSYASHVNNRQRRFVRDLVARTFHDRRPVQHDFACGTGRAIRLLHGLVRAAHGYDPSAEMLAKATEAGTVTYAGSEVKGYGNLVLIRHDNGYVSAYAHNGSLGVKRGEKVKRGQVIATSGQTGNVTSPQLHFEIRKGSTPVDPTQYLNGN